MTKARQARQRLALVVDFNYLAPAGHELDLFTGRAPLGLVPQAALTISRARCEALRSEITPRSSSLPVSRIAAEGRLTPA